MTVKTTLPESSINYAFSLLLSFILIFPFLESKAQLSLANTTTTYTENFNTLISTGSGTWTDNSTLLNWYAARTGTGTSIAASTGSSTAGNLYSYGSTASSDRALGSVGSSNVAAGIFAWGIRIKNNTGGPVVSLDISYAGEQWRDAAITAQTVTFWYQTSNTPITTFAATTTGFTAFSTLDFTSPQFTSSTGITLDGNLPANRVIKTATLTVALNAGDEIMLKWYDIDHPSSDHALGVDDFSVKANAGAGCTPTQLAISAINGSDPVNAITANQSFSVTVESRDAGNSPCNVSVNTPVSITLLTGSGSLAGILSGTINSGTSTTTISGVLYNTVETGISLTADDGPGGLTAANSSTFRSLGLNEIILPQYIEGINNGTNSTRIPYAYRVSLSGLNPNTIYRYYNEVDTLGSSPNSNGSGNCIYVHSTGNFSKSTAPKLTTVGDYDSLTTDGSGSYTGWFVTEPVANNRFTPDSIVNMIILLNNGAGGNSEFYRVRTTSGVTVKSIGTGSTQGTGIYSYTNGFPKNFVMLYDNTAGSGRPLTGTFLEDDNTDNTTSYATFYGANVDFINGAWGSFLPNALPAGLQRIEQRALSTGVIVGCPAIDADGIWPSGVNTVNPNGGVSELALDITLDDPLSSPTATASNNGPACEGGTINLTSSGGVSYSWSGPFYSSTQQNPVLSTVTLANAGTYIVTVSDANGCTATSTTVLVVNANPLATAGNNGPVCDGENVTLSSSGGNSYSWSGPLSYTSGQQNPVLSGTTLAMAGTYTVTVTGANLCTATASTVVVVNPIPDLSPLSPVSNSCPATTVDLTAITVTDVNSTTGNLSYYTNLTDANAGTNALTLLQAQSISITGIYYIRKTTNSTPSCFDVVSVNVTVNSCTCTPPSLSESHINVSCNGGTNGSINLSVNSGVAPFSYAWSNGASSEDVSSLAAGTYTVTVTDAQPCSSVFIVVITQPAVLSISSTPVNITCNGGTNGSVSITASGGTPAYGYNWSTGSTQQNISGLIAGTYTVTVTDVNGCSASAGYTLTQPAAIVITPVTVNVLCNGGNNGSISLSVSGGVPGYSYSWSTGSTLQNQSGLVAGTYTVTVTDANTCTVSSVSTITQPSAVSVNPSITNVSCFQGNNGSITISVSGGVQPYTYSWSTGATTSGIITLSAATYSATVTDQNGCSVSNGYAVSQPAALSLQISAGNLSCGNGNNGSANLTVTGGTPSYTYSWSNGGTTEDLAGLMPGSFTVTVTDAHGCSATKSATLTSPPSIVLGATSTAAACGQNNGTVTLTASGGTPIGSNTPGLLISEYTANPPGTDSPFEWAEFVATKPINFASTPYSVIFANNGTATTKGWKQGLAITYGFNLTTGSVNTGDIVYVGGSSMTPTGTKLRLINTGTTGGDGSLGSANSAGVLGNGGANADAIGVFNLPISSLDSNSVPVDAIFFGTGIGGAAVNAGADGYQLPSNDRYAGGKLQTASFFGPDPTNGGFTVAAGSFNVSSNTFGVIRTWTNSATFTDNGSAVSLTNLPVAPYTYAWSNGSTTQNLAAVPGGTYTVTVTDGNSCTVTTSVVVSTPVITLTVTANNVSCNGLGSATASASGGLAPYQYLWNNGATTATISGLSANTYTVTATDVNGCSSISSVVVSPPAILNATGIVSNPACRGAATGSIALTVTGGVQPYSYLWTGGVTTQNRTGLGIGSYTVTVTDANGCTVIKSFTITQPSSNLLINTSKTNVRCFGLASGIAGVSPTGGTAPYTYLWSTVAAETTSAVSGLLAGSYTCTVTDAIGCAKSTIIIITEPTDIVVFQTQTNVTFPGGSNGTAAVSASGGTPGYTYSWNTIPVKTTATVTGLTAGTYKCTVTDSKQCPKKVTFIITEPASKTTLPGTKGNDWKITAYPNPTSGMVMLSFENKSVESFAVLLTDFTGREVYKTEGNTEKGMNEFVYDFTELGKGVYFMKVSTSDKYDILKIVIQ